MYLDKLALRNIRTFDRYSEIEFSHSDREFSSLRENAGRPRLANVNLLLGDNGSGKTTLLQAVALAAFGPAVAHANLGPRHLVRSDDAGQGGEGEATGEIRASFRLHPQDSRSGGRSDSTLTIRRRGELEQIEFDGQRELWDRVFESKNDAYFVVAYGATRRVEPGEGLDMGARSKSHFLRAQRVQSVFRDSYSLIPLTYWLPELRRSNPERYSQVVRLINRILRRNGSRSRSNLTAATTDSSAGERKCRSRVCRMDTGRSSAGLRIYCITSVSDALRGRNW